MHFNKKYPWDGADVMSKFTGGEVWIFPDADGVDVMKLFYAGEVWEIETPHPPQTLAQTPEIRGIFPLYLGLSVWWESTTGLYRLLIIIYILTSKGGRKAVFMLKFLLSAK